MLGKLWTREELLKLAEDKRREGREVEMIEYVTDMGGEGFFQTKLVVKAMGIYIYISRIHEVLKILQEGL